jgi:hypothetical protein
MISLDKELLGRSSKMLLGHPMEPRDKGWLAEKDDDVYARSFARSS